jgi:hypothetical protein
MTYDDAFAERNLNVNIHSVVVVVEEGKYPSLLSPLRTLRGGFFFLGHTHRGNPPTISRRLSKTKTSLNITCRCRQLQISPLAQVSLDSRKNTTRWLVRSRV